VFECDVIYLDRDENAALAVETPHLVQNRLQSAAVFVDRPELDLRLRKGGGDRS
jgi:hypothetical protein